MELIKLAFPYKYIPPSDEDYALLLVIEDIDISQKLQAKISDDIVASNCVYFLARGHECSSWDTSVDIACIDQDKYIMTTWHEDEPIEDTVFFLDFIIYGRDEDRLIKKKYIMFVGADDDYIKKYRKIIENKSYLP